jgi:hypothetical protein
MGVGDNNNLPPPIIPPSQIDFNHSGALQNNSISQVTNRDLEERTSGSITKSTTRKP